MCVQNRRHIRLIVKRFILSNDRKPPFYPLKQKMPLFPGSVQYRVVALHVRSDTITSRRKRHVRDSESQQQRRIRGTLDDNNFGCFRASRAERHPPEPIVFHDCFG